MVRSTTTTSNSSSRRWWHRLVCQCWRGGGAERDSSHHYERVREYPRFPLNTPPPDRHPHAYVGLGRRCCSDEQYEELIKNLEMIQKMLDSLVNVHHGYTIMRPVIPPRPPDVYIEWLLEWLDHGKP